MKRFTHWISTSPIRRSTLFPPFRRLARLALLAGALAGIAPLQAAIQFDVFLGYGGQSTGADGVAREAGWFSAGCEILNDGPSFNGVVEFSPGQMGGGQVRRFAIELPTNTRKRFSLPVFSGAGYSSVWDARLLDERGKVRAEKTGLRPRNTAWETFLLAALPRTFGGAPKLPELPGNNKNSTAQPIVARIPVEQFPDSAIAMEGLDALYLNSEKAAELKPGQSEAITTWVLGGGHLILAVEQSADLNASPWLQALSPIQFRDGVIRTLPEDAEAWLGGGGDAPTSEGRSGGHQSMVPKYRPPGSAAGLDAGGGNNPFAGRVLERAMLITEFPVATGKLRDGRILLGAKDAPLIVRANRGRGLVTVLAFSPEREPFRSWDQRDWFWARLVELPSGLFTTNPLNSYGGWSVDAVFGAMIDSRQIRKLPVRWLLLLLAVYLIVIGPLDQYWLKKINRQMLTWVTFPAYVVLFSLLIYYIGYRLRAGETEWNEFHIVDVLPRGTQTEWRGRTYASIYSPVNETYTLSADLPEATLRGEFLGPYSGGQESGRLTVDQHAGGFRAEVYVPVWTSQLIDSEWVQDESMPFTASLVPGAAGLQVRMTNHLDRPLTGLHLVARDQVYRLADLPANGSAEATLEPQTSEPLASFVQQRASEWQVAAQTRNQAFGDNSSRWVDLNATNAVVASFLGQMSGGQNQRSYVIPAGLDLSTLVERGDAVLLAWDAGHAPIPTFKRFKSVRTTQNTIYRLALPISDARAL